MALEVFYVVVLIFFAFMTLLNIPGPFLVSLGTLIYGYQTDFNTFTFTMTLVFIGLGIFGLVLDNIFTLLGARKFGASKYGIIGAFLGFLAIFIVGPAGILVGPPIGAFLAETLISKKSTDQALQAAMGSVLGLVSGIIAKFLLALGMVIYFAFIIF